MRAMYSAATRKPEFSMISAVLRPPSQAPAQTENPTPSLQTGTYWMAPSAAMSSCRLRCQPSGNPETKSIPASLRPASASRAASGSMELLYSGERGALFFGHAGEIPRRHGAGQHLFSDERRLRADALRRIEHHALRRLRHARECGLLRVAGDAARVHYALHFRK